MIPDESFVRESLRREIEDAKRQSISSKLSAGPELFDYACTASLMGIRGENPGISDEDAMAELRRRVELGKKIEVNAWKRRISSES